MSDYVFPAMNAATGGAGGYSGGPWRIVLHTTETNSRPSSWIPTFQYPSHVVCSFEHQEIFQLIGFNEAGKALYHYSGQTETNRQSAIQIEINGIADEAGSWSDAKLQWLGIQVIAPIINWINVNGGGFNPINIPAPGAHGGSASETAPQRMSNAQWASFNGVCGHRHVPQNDHYDPDQLDVNKVIGYALGNLGPAEEVDMDSTQDARLTNVEKMLHDWLGPIFYETWAPSAPSLMRTTSDNVKQLLKGSVGTASVSNGASNTFTLDDVRNVVHQELAKLGLTVKD